MKQELKNLTSYKLGKDGIKVILNEDALREIWDIDTDNSYLQELYYVSSIDYDNNLLQLVSVVNEQYGLDDIEINMIFLMLYPLSMLTQEIEHNGKKFIPASKMITHGFHNSFWYELEKFNYRYLYTMDLELLLSWHIDIYNLIPNNLAIDKTTLNEK